MWIIQAVLLAAISTTKIDARNLRTNIFEKGHGEALSPHDGVTFSAKFDAGQSALPEQIKMINAAEDEFVPQESEKKGGGKDDKKAETNKDKDAKVSSTPDDAEAGGNGNDIGNQEIETNKDNDTTEEIGDVSNIDGYDVLQPCTLLERQVDGIVTCEFETLDSFLSEKAIAFDLELGYPVCATETANGGVCLRPTYGGAVDLDDKLLSSSITLRDITIGTFQLGDIQFDLGICLGSISNRKSVDSAVSTTEKYYSLQTDESTRHLQDNEADTGGNPFANFCECVVSYAGMPCKSCQFCNGGGIEFDCTNLVPYLGNSNECEILSTITSLAGSGEQFKPLIPNFLLNLQVPRGEEQNGSETGDESVATRSEYVNPDDENDTDPDMKSDVQPVNEADEDVPQFGFDTEKGNDAKGPTRPAEQSSASEGNKPNEEKNKDDDKNKDDKNKDDKNKNDKNKDDKNKAPDGKNDDRDNTDSEKPNDKANGPEKNPGNNQHAVQDEDERDNNNAATKDNKTKGQTPDAKPNQQSNNKGPEPDAKPNQQSNNKAQTPDAKPNQQSNNKGPEPDAKPNQQSNNKGPEPNAKPNQQSNNKGQTPGDAKPNQQSNNKEQTPGNAKPNQPGNNKEQTPGNAKPNQPGNNNNKDANEIEIEDAKVDNKDKGKNDAKDKNKNGNQGANQNANKNNDNTIESIQDFFDNLEWTDYLKPCTLLERQFKDVISCKVDVASSFLAERSIKFEIASGKPLCAYNRTDGKICVRPGYSGEVDLDDVLLASSISFTDIIIGNIELGDIAFELGVCFGKNNDGRESGSVVEHYGPNNEYVNVWEYHPGADTHDSSSRFLQVRAPTPAKAPAQAPTKAPPKASTTKVHHTRKAHTTTVTYDGDGRFLQSAPTNAPTKAPTKAPTPAPTSAATTAAPTNRFVKFCECSVTFAGSECKTCKFCSGGGIQFDCTNVLPFVTNGKECESLQMVTSLVGSGKHIQLSIPKFLQNLQL